MNTQLLDQTHSRRIAIIEIAQRLYQRNMLAAADGNISYRLDDDHILITPPGISKAYMKPDQFSIITLNNEVIMGKPSSERLMHLAIYNACPKAKAVIHAHPPNAIAWSILQPQLTELPIKSLSEAIIALGRIPIAPYARPGTQSMADNILPFIAEYRAMILARHGAVSWGENLEEAMNGIERIEHVAHILTLAQQLGSVGPISDLSEEEVTALYQLRKTLEGKNL